MWQATEQFLFSSITEIKIPPVSGLRFIYIYFLNYILISLFSLSLSFAVFPFGSFIFTFIHDGWGTTLHHSIECFKSRISIFRWCPPGSPAAWWLIPTNAMDVGLRVFVARLRLRCAEREERSNRLLWAKRGQGGGGRITGKTCQISDVWSVYNWLYWFKGCQKRRLSQTRRYK